MKYNKATFQAGAIQRRPDRFALADEAMRIAPSPTPASNPAPIPPAAAPTRAGASKKPFGVRTSFYMPTTEAPCLRKLARRVEDAGGFRPSEGEIIRTGLRLLEALSDMQLATATAAVSTRRRAEP